VRLRRIARQTHAVELKRAKPFKTLHLPRAACGALLVCCEQLWRDVHRPFPLYSSGNPAQNISNNSEPFQPWITNINRAENVSIRNSTAFFVRAVLNFAIQRKKTSRSEMELAMRSKKLPVLAHNCLDRVIYWSVT
jgi:hypothetical protein